MYNMRVAPWNASLLADHDHARIINITVSYKTQSTTKKKVTSQPKGLDYASAVQFSLQATGDNFFLLGVFSWPLVVNRCFQIPA